MCEALHPHPLLIFARSVIETAVRGGGDIRSVPVPDSQERAHGGVFVTLRISNRLRGCIGCLDSRVPFIEALRSAAHNSAMQDPRFEPLSADELANVEIEISILSEPTRTLDPLSLELGRDGVLIRRGKRRGLFLPKVATECGFDRETFLSRCCAEKAQLPPDAWRDRDTHVFLFTTETLCEGGAPAS